MSDPFDNMEDALKVIYRYKAQMVAEQCLSAKITCPTCKVKGALHLRLTKQKYRGHQALRAWCDTENCLRLIE